MNTMSLSIARIEWWPLYRVRLNSLELEEHLVMMDHALLAH